jgi:hypothetical protein
MRECVTGEGFGCLRDGGGVILGKLGISTSFMKKNCDTLDFYCRRGYMWGIIGYKFEIVFRR